MRATMAMKPISKKPSTTKTAQESCATILRK
jgi:hypothetical protein